MAVVACITARPPVGVPNGTLQATELVRPGLQYQIRCFNSRLSYRIARVCSSPGRLLGDLRDSGARFPKDAVITTTQYAFRTTVAATASPAWLGYPRTSFAVRCIMAYSALDFAVDTGKMSRRSFWPPGAVQTSVCHSWTIGKFRF